MRPYTVCLQQSIISLVCTWDTRYSYYSGATLLWGAEYLSYLVKLQVKMARKGLKNEDKTTLWSHHTEATTAVRLCIVYSYILITIPALTWSQFTLYCRQTLINFRRACVGAGWNKIGSSAEFTTTADKNNTHEARLYRSCPPPPRTLHSYLFHPLMNLLPSITLS